MNPEVWGEGPREGMWEEGIGTSEHSIWEAQGVEEEENAQTS